jgi:hypothetical protein
MSGEARWQDQISWLIAAVAFVVLAGSSLAGWILTEARRVRREAAALMSVIRVQRLGLPSLFDPRAVAATPSSTAPGLSANVMMVTGPRMTRMHRPDCLLVRNKPVHPVTEDPRSAVLEECGVCRG